MNREEENILEQTRLMKEFVNLPANGGNTEEEAQAIDTRKAEIKTRLEELKKELGKDV